MLNNLLSPFWSVFCIELISASFGIVWEIGKYFGELITRYLRHLIVQSTSRVVVVLAVVLYCSYNFVLILRILSHKAKKIWYLRLYVFSQMVTLSSLIYVLCVWFAKYIFCVKFSVYFSYSPHIIHVFITATYHVNLSSTYRWKDTIIFPFYWHESNGWLITIIILSGM